MVIFIGTVFRYLYCSNGHLQLPHQTVEEKAFYGRRKLVFEIRFSVLTNIKVIS